jgi:hypothetical protein
MKSTYFGIKNLSKTGIFATIMAFFFVVSTPAYPAVDETAISELRAQIAALTSRLDELEKAGVEAREEVVAVRDSTSKMAWTEKIRLTGDLRYRYENIDDDRRDDDRDRNRIRARAEISARVSDTLKFGLGLASGGDDPLSTNQTLGNANSTKGINLDLAYYDWEILDNFHWVGGKYKNPVYRPQKHGLVWDGDLRPEGMSLKYDDKSLFGHVGFNFINSDSGSSGNNDTETVYSLQAGYRTKLGDNVKLTIGGGYFYAPIKGTSCRDTLKGKCEVGDGNLFGNSLSPDGTFLYDYEVVEGFAELHLKLGELPLIVYGDYVQNQDADDEDTGYAIGFKLGAAKAPGTWQLQYTYQDLEADAVLGLFSDSDFAGGGTDNSGHAIKGGYQITKKTQLGLTYFINEYGEFTRSKDIDYERLQLDLKFKY